jgi:hypothetical protein
MTLANRLYYQLKPFIPRTLQILLRRSVALQKRKSYTYVWPIDEKAGKVPKGWSGWPEGKQFALVLMRDVDTAEGHSKCHKLIKLEEKMGFRSSFNFVPERYKVSPELRDYLVKKGFEVPVHGLRHDGKLFQSREAFKKQAICINQYMKKWQSIGFVSPSMHRNLDWIHDLNMEYDASTFDTDPFEPQSDGMCTIFPFWVKGNSNQKGYVELPYTLPQDFTLFIIMKEKSIDIWKRKLDWIVENRGMAMVITHPDYMNFDGKKPTMEEYPVEYYKELLQYIKSKYDRQFWNALPKEMARFWKELNKNTKQ